MSEKITFKELVEKISESTDQSEQSINSFIHELVEIIESGLEKGDKITISGFGRFELRWMDPRKGRNPQTGEEISIPGQNKVVFKPYKDLREHVNLPFKNLEPQILDSSPGKKASDKEKEKEEPETATAATSVVASATGQFEENPKISGDFPDDLIVERPSPLADQIALSKTADDRNGTNGKKSDHKLPVEVTTSVNEITDESSGQPGWADPEKKSRFRWTYIAVSALLLFLILLIIFIRFQPTEPSLSTEAPVAEEDVQIELNQVERPAALPPTPAATIQEPDAVTAQPADPEFTEHSITSGDTLWTIAERTYGVPFLWPIIFHSNINELENPNQIVTGGVLNVPVISDPENLTEAESQLVARGYINVYDWKKEFQPDNARYFLWAAGSFSRQELERVSNRVDQSDLAFATQQ